MQRKARGMRIHTGFSAAKLRLYLQSFIVKCNQDFFQSFIKLCFCYIFFFSIVYHLYFFMAFCMYSLGEQP